MKTDKKIVHKIKFFLFFPAFLLAGCSYNPFIGDNHTTGDPAGAVVGAGVGAGSVALLNGSKTMMAAAGLAGGVVGYYVTTLRYDSGGIIHAGGQVYKVGDYVGIYIPTDNLFEPNTADFNDKAQPILDSTVTVLQRYPDSNVLVSGNTSGFGRPRWEQKLSEERAKKVSAYLWNAGINNFGNQSIETSRKLDYVGYGDYFPISSSLTNNGVRSNSRIQITVYPSKADLHLDNKHLAFHNVGAMQDETTKRAKSSKCGDSMDASGCFVDD